MQHIPKGGLFRVVMAMLFCIAAAYGNDFSNAQPEEKTLAVSVSAADTNEIAQALDLRDLEHFFVSELKRKRFDVIGLTSLQDEPDESVYLVEVGIDQADVAQRPIRVLGQSRFRDDEILHVELSLAVSQGDDTLGELHRSDDYRAEDYGTFSTPQAVRGAVYESLSRLASEFASGIERGDFTADLESFQHPLAADDVLELWTSLPIELRVVLAFVAFLVFIGCLTIVFRLTSVILGLFAPRRLAPQYVVVRDERPLPPQARTVVEADSDKIPTAV